MEIKNSYIKPTQDVRKKKKKSCNQRDQKKKKSCMIRL